MPPNNLQPPLALPTPRASVGNSHDDDIHDDIVVAVVGGGESGAGVGWEKALADRPPVSDLSSTTAQTVPCDEMDGIPPAAAGSASASAAASAAAAASPSAASRAGRLPGRRTPGGWARHHLDDSVSLKMRKNNHVLDDEEHSSTPNLTGHLRPREAVFHERDSVHHALHAERHRYGLVPPRPAAAVVEEESDSDDEDGEHGSGRRGKRPQELSVAVAGAVEVEVKVEATPLLGRGPISPPPVRSCLKEAAGADGGEGGISKKKKRVEFDSIILRNYSIIIGDNPSVSYGPPLSLSWDYVEYAPVDVDDYERNRGERRNLRQMVLNYYNRRNLLRLHGNYSDEELRAAWKDVKKVRRQRYITQNYMSSFPLRHTEEALQSAVRKVKRVTGAREGREGGEGLEHVQ
jgi:hypothetical protein